MQICEWMTRDVITVTPEATLSRAAKLLTEHGIRRLPVVDGQNRLVGIVSDRDVKAASPSRATSLDIYELMYLLSEIPVRDIMTANPIGIAPDQTVETAALIMEEKGIGGIPVIDADRKVIGIITDSDIFKVLVAISGVRNGGTQLCFETQPGHETVRRICDLLRERGAQILSLQTVSDFTLSASSQRVYIRICNLPSEQENALRQLLNASGFRLVYWVKDGWQAVNTDSRS